MIYLILLVVAPVIGCKASAQTEKNSTVSKAAQDDQAAGFVEIGKFDDLSILECSGIAPSLNFEQHYWVHNDSGDEPLAFLIHASGKIKQKFQLDGVINKDFEDCATFQFNGESYLAIGDIGNNRRNRTELSIYLFKEPAELSNDAAPKLTPVATIRFKYEDGVNRDAESLAYFPVTQQFVLASKLSARDLLKSDQAELFTIDFNMNKGRQRQLAKRVGTLPGGMNTAMDISGDGRFLVVRNYIHGYLFELKDSKLDLNEESAKSVTLPMQQQGEAICFSKDGKRMIVTSEGKHQKIFSLERPH